MDAQKQDVKDPWINANTGKEMSSNACAVSCVRTSYHITSDACLGSASQSNLSTMVSLEG